VERPPTRQRARDRPRAFLGPLAAFWRRRRGFFLFGEFEPAEANEGAAARVSTAGTTYVAFLRNSLLVVSVGETSPDGMDSSFVPVT
jgi:hypothetical protein